MAYKRIVILFALFAFFIGIAFATDYNEKGKQDSKMMGIKTALMPLDKELSILKKITKGIPLQLKQIEKILGVKLVKADEQSDPNYIVYRNNESKDFGEIEVSLSKIGKKGSINIEFKNPIGFGQLREIFGGEYKRIMAAPRTPQPKNYIKEIHDFKTKKFRASAAARIGDELTTVVVLDWTFDWTK